MRWILTDVDGVLTDGRVSIDIHGNETKMICYRDLDAIGVGRRNGFDFAFVTGEDTEMVRALAKRFGIERVYPGAKNKLAVIQRIAAEAGAELSEFVYIGDSDNDAPALELVGLGIAPHDATTNARHAAHVVSDTRGGYGVLLEIVDKLISGKLKHPGMPT